jgi:hypothetical protein
MILDLDGKQVVVNSDLGKIRLQLWVNRGCSGIELDSASAKELGIYLFNMARRMERGK